MKTRALAGLAALQLWLGYTEGWRDCHGTARRAARYVLPGPDASRTANRSWAKAAPILPAQDAYLMSLHGRRDVVKDA
jgi:hypothetical protein